MWWIPMCSESDWHIGMKPYRKGNIEIDRDKWAHDWSIWNECYVDDTK